MGRSGGLWGVRRSLVAAVVRRSVATQAAEFQLPKRIPRGPTTILEALRTATLKEKDPTASHYTYMDDPHLIPITGRMKAEWALSKELGKRAAREIVLEWPELFEYGVDDPPMSFRPEDEASPRLIDEKRSSEADLLRELSAGRPESVAAIYANAKEEGVSLSGETQVKLLEMLAWLGPTDPPDLTVSEWPQERYFRSFIEFKMGGGFTAKNKTGVHQKKEAPVRFWDSNGEAEALFLSLAEEDLGSRAYSAMIAGLAKHERVERAWELAKTARESGKTILTEAVAALISTAHSETDGRGEEAWELALGELREYAASGQRPRRLVFDATLRLLAKRTWKDRKEKSLLVVQEMLRVGLEPGLATYVALWRVWEQSNQLIPIVQQSLDRLERQKEWRMESRWDDDFLESGMFITCAASNQSNLLAMRFHNLVSQRLGSPAFIFPSAEAEVAYYGRLMSYCLSSYKNFDDFFQIYQGVVPNHYIPNHAFMREILDQVKYSGAWHTLPLFWTDLLRIGAWTHGGCTLSLAIALSMSLKSHTAHSNSATKAKQDALDITRHWLEMMESQFGVPFFKPFTLFAAPHLVVFADVAFRAGDPQLSWRLCQILCDCVQRETTQESGKWRGEHVGEDGQVPRLIRNDWREGDVAKLATYFLHNQEPSRALALLACARALNRQNDERPIVAAFQFAISQRPDWLTTRHIQLLQDAIQAGSKPSLTSALDED